MVSLLRAVRRSFESPRPSSDIGPSLPTAREQALALDLMVEESTCLALMDRRAFVRQTYAAVRGASSWRARLLGRLVASLRAGFDGGVDYPGQLADWLGWMVRLYGDLDARHLPKVLAVHASFFARRRSLHAPVLARFSEHLPEAFAAVEQRWLLEETIPADRGTLAGLSRYWEAAGQLAPLLASDEGAFGREELLDHRGWRTARELVEGGLLPPGVRALDLGCGVGRVTRYLAPLCAEVFAVDVSRSMLERARRRVGELPNVTWCANDGVKLPMATAAVNLVLCLRVLEHVADHRCRGEVLAELGRVVAAGGRVVLTFGEEAVRAEGGLELFDVRLRKLARVAGFELVALVEPEGGGEWRAELQRR